MIPTIFKDVDLLFELVLGYDEITHEVNDINGNVFLRIYANSIKKAFNLHTLDETTYSVNFEMFGKAFDSVGIELNR